MVSSKGATCDAVAGKDEHVVLEVLPDLEDAASSSSGFRRVKRLGLVDLAGDAAAAEKIAGAVLWPSGT